MKLKRKSKVNARAKKITIYKRWPLFNGRPLDLDNAQECEAAVKAGAIKEPNNLWVGTFFPIREPWPGYFLLPPLIPIDSAGKRRRVQSAPSRAYPGMSTSKRQRT